VVSNLFLTAATTADSLAGEEWYVNRESGHPETAERISDS
jgi:hypothetical protein